jgi:hypothetical protein
VATTLSRWVRLTDASRHPDMPGRDAHPVFEYTLSTIDGRCVMGHFLLDRFVDQRRTPSHLIDRFVGPCPVLIAPQQL